MWAIIVVDLTPRLNRLAEAVPEVRPRDLEMVNSQWFARGSFIDSDDGCWIGEHHAHALWLASILTWLVKHPSVESLDIKHGPLGWSVGWLFDETTWETAPTLLLAALSAAEKVAGISTEIRT